MRAQPFGLNTLQDWCIAYLRTPDIYLGAVGTLKNLTQQANTRREPAEYVIY